MNDHITKPVAPDRLAATLAKWLSAKGGRPARDKPALPLVSDPVTPRYPAELLSMKSVDAAQGIRRIGGKPDAYRKQLLRFRENYANAIDELERLVTQKGAQAGEEYCHALKGVSGNLGANELFTAMTGMDGLLKQGKMPEKAQFEHLRELLQDMLAEIDGLKGAKPSATGTAKLLSRDELLAKLAALGMLLENDLGAADALLTELRSGSMDAEVAGTIREIAASIDVFAIEEAQKKINGLRERLGRKA